VSISRFSDRTYCVEKDGAAYRVEARCRGYDAAIAVLVEPLAKRAKRPPIAPRNPAAAAMTVFGAGRERRVSGRRAALEKFVGKPGWNSWEERPVRIARYAFNASLLAEAMTVLPTGRMTMEIEVVEAIPVLRMFVGSARVCVAGLRRQSFVGAKLPSWPRSERPLDRRSK
jgi:hypothetical protein